MITSSIKTSKCAFEPNKITKTLAKIGGFIPKPVSDFCDLTPKASMKRTTQFVILAGCVLFGRYIQARNKDEKREILTRDTGMLFTAVYAVPLFKKLASLFINKKTGIPVAHGEKGLLKNINPEKGIQMASYEQLEGWLSVKNAESFNGIKHGLTGFCANIKGLGGNLMKCFEILNKNSEKTLNDLAKLVGIDEKVTNKNILKVIYNAEKSTDQKIQTALNELKKLFVRNELNSASEKAPLFRSMTNKLKKIMGMTEEGMNPLLKKASHYKSVTGASCIAATAFILGGLLPWFNIQHTKKLYDEKKKAENNGLNNEQTKTLPINNSNMMNKFELFQKTGQFV